MAAGVCAFLPWVPTFWFQLHHTGTPWAAPADFTALVYTFTQFAGGNSDAGRAWRSCWRSLPCSASPARRLDGRRVVLDLRTRPGVRGLALLAVGTLLIALIAGKLTGSTFADRYSAVILVPCLLVVAYGVTALADRRVRHVRRRHRRRARSGGVDPERVPHADPGGAGGFGDTGRVHRPATSWPTAPTSWVPAVSRAARRPLRRGRVPAGERRPRS